MPIFHMSLFKVPSGTLRLLESIRGKFFTGHDFSSKKVSWVQWDKVLAPKVNGGLGVFSLYALNRGLLFKWVWRFLAHESSLWYKVIKAIHGANGNIGGIPKHGASSCWLNIINEVKVRVPRGGAESSQVEELKRLIQPVILKQGKDSWNWSLSKSGTYSVASVRNLIDSSLLPWSDMKTRWISYIPNKVNVFAWKVLDKGAALLL
nr:RNA-directed DNA polymerase, eukaryota, reverse transcriptase zinc-binding domain protein [Tanacetum cinerariifolium]